MRCFRIRTFRIQLILLVLVLLAFSLSSKRQAFPGISYEQKDRVVRELAPERNNKLRRSLIHIRGWNGK